MSEECCLSWEPIPETFNHAWAVDVVHVEETYTYEAIQGGGYNLAIAVAAYASEKDAREVGAWRLFFTGCQAYRMRLIGYPQNLPLTQPGDFRACWELFPSRFLDQSMTQQLLDGDSTLRPHHFVIFTGGSIAYEIIANSWRSEQLSSDWARPFQSPVPAQGEPA